MASMSTTDIHNDDSNDCEMMMNNNGMTIVDDNNGSSSVFPPLNLKESNEMEESFLMELESYLGRYKHGECRWKRLQFIMNRSTVGGNLYATTQLLLKEQLQEVGNIVLYRQLFASAATSSTSATNDDTKHPPPNHNHHDDDYLKLAESQYVEQCNLCERRFMSILHQTSNHHHMGSSMDSSSNYNRDTLLRTAQMELAKCHANVGDYATAVHKMLVNPNAAASAAGNGTTTTRYNNKHNKNDNSHLWSLCLEWAWYGDKHANLRNFSHKLENQPNHKAKCQAVMGLYHLVRGNFVDATYKFHELLATLQQQQQDSSNNNNNHNLEQISCFLSSEDVGLYTALLTLASPPQTNHQHKHYYSPMQHRQELLNLLSTHFITTDSASNSNNTSNSNNNTTNNNNNTNTAATTDANLIPMELRTALLHFTRAQYGSCLLLLQQVIQKHVSYDLYLYPHIHTLWNQICQNIYVFYLQPYSTIRLDKFASEFSMPIAKMQQFIISHSSKSNSNHSMFRMDESTQTLHVPKRNRSHTASSSLRRALKLGQTLEQNILTLLLKQSAWDQGIVISRKNNRHSNTNRHYRSDNTNRGGAGDIKIPEDDDEDDDDNDDSMEEEEAVVEQGQTTNSNNNKVIMMEMVEDE